MATYVFDEGEVTLFFIQIQQSLDINISQSVLLWIYIGSVSRYVLGYLILWAYNIRSFLMPLSIHGKKT